MTNRISNIVANGVNLAGADHIPWYSTKKLVGVKHMATLTAPYPNSAGLERRVSPWTSSPESGSPDRIRTPSPRLRHQWNGPSLVDSDHWAEVIEDLRKKGVRLPCEPYLADSKKGPATGAVQSAGSRGDCGVLETKDPKTLSRRGATDHELFECESSEEEANDEGEGYQSEASDDATVIAYPRQDKLQETMSEMKIIVGDIVRAVVRSCV